MPRSKGPIASWPPRSGALWRDIEAALVGLGAGVSAGRGQHVRIAFRGRRGVIQRQPAAARIHPLDLAAIGRLLRGDVLPPPPPNGALRVENYSAAVSYDPQEEMFHAQAADMPDLIAAWGRNQSGLREAFAAAVDDYRWFCKARGEYPALPRHQ
ncbi:MAG: hypothetical protein JWN93_3256 [Hyphomicrobiales bacterium]|nr:hypothetical protein [Hyphomicrobiales bacterium]